MNKVHIPCLYRRVWEDGFGARGWKLASATQDPEIIASTAATGERIPTSVFVHDILDHFLCGLGPSGHRNEAVALIQLAARTGTDPRPDFAQMVDEDLLQGRVIGESLDAFLPPELALWPAPDGRGPEGAIARLWAQLPREVLRERLIARFFELGEAGASMARQKYAAHGLDVCRRGPLGLALQKLLERADSLVQGLEWEAVTAQVWVTRERCGFVIEEPQPWSKVAVY